MWYHLQYTKKKKKKKERKVGFFTEKYNFAQKYRILYVSSNNIDVWRAVSYVVFRGGRKSTLHTSPRALVRKGAESRPSAKNSAKMITSFRL